MPPAVQHVWVGDEQLGTVTDAWPVVLGRVTVIDL